MIRVNMPCAISYMSLKYVYLVQIVGLLQLHYDATSFSPIPHPPISMSIVKIMINLQPIILSILCHILFTFFPFWHFSWNTRELLSVLQTWQIELPVVNKTLRPHFPATPSCLLSKYMYVCVCVQFQSASIRM